MIHGFCGDRIREKIQIANQTKDCQHLPKPVCSFSTLIMRTTLESAKFPLSPPCDFMTMPSFNRLRLSIYNIRPLCALLAALAVSTGLAADEKNSTRLDAGWE